MNKKKFPKNRKIKGKCGRAQRGAHFILPQRNRKMQPQVRKQKPKTNHWRHFNWPKNTKIGKA